MTCYTHKQTQANRVKRQKYGLKKKRNTPKITKGRKLLISFTERAMLNSKPFLQSSRAKGQKSLAEKMTLNGKPSQQISGIIRGQRNFVTLTLLIAMQCTNDLLSLEQRTFNVCSIAGTVCCGLTCFTSYIKPVDPGSSVGTS